MPGALRDLGARLEGREREGRGDEEVVGLVEEAHAAPEFHADVDGRQIVECGETGADVADLPQPRVEQLPLMRPEMLGHPGRPREPQGVEGVHRIGEVGVGLLDVRPQPRQPLYRPPHCRRDRRTHRHLAAEGGRVGDAQAANPAGQARREGAGRRRERRPVTGVGRADDVQEQGRVGRVTGHRADVRQRAEGARRVQRDTAVRGFHAEDSAEGGRNTNTAAAVGAERERSRAERHRGPRPAAGAARGAGRVVRVAGDAGQRRVGDALPAELGCRRLAEEHHAVRAQPGHGGRVLVPTALLRDGLRTLPRRTAPHQQDVLHGDRDPVEQTGRFTAPPALGRLAGLREGLVRGEAYEGVDLRLDPFGPLQGGAGGVDGAELPFPVPVEELYGGQFGQIRHASPSSRRHRHQRPGTYPRFLSTTFSSGLPAAHLSYNSTN